jgi:hypothetical protein
MTMGYRVVEIPTGHRSKVSEHLEDALVALGKAMHYAEAGEGGEYYGNREPSMHERMPEQMPGRFMDDGSMNMRGHGEQEHSDEYLRGWNDHAQMMGMRTRSMRRY